MLPLIGLIVGVYGIARLIQVPLEMLNAIRLAAAVRPLNRDDEPPITPGIPLFIVMIVSGIAGVVLFIMMILLIRPEQPMPPMPRF